MRKALFELFFSARGMSVSDVDILTVLDHIASDASKVKYGLDVQCALLRAAGEIKKLRGRVMMLEAEVFLAQIHQRSENRES